MTLKAYVVEDNPAIRESLVETLSELAGMVTAGATGREPEAIAWLTAADAEWDIAIVDLMLEAGGSGLRVLAALCARKPEQKVVVLTGTASIDMRRECEALGCDRVFDKSMEAEGLLDYCQALARQEQGNSPVAP